MGFHLKYLYENSTEVLQSGMLLQIDIIPSVSGYTGSSAESTILLANEFSRNQIKKEYPDGGELPAWNLKL